jgi:hypothetical protein
MTLTRRKPAAAGGEGKALVLKRGHSIMKGRQPPPRRHNFIFG